jgi:lipoprotein-releasing system permease protein
LDYDKRITAVYVNCKQNESIEPLKEKLTNLLGSSFEVKTHFEKNELIYQTSKSEKIIVITILVFIFILAIFNLIASLTMLYIEKKDNIVTLKSMGATKSFIFNIFFYEGLLISFKGILYGVVGGILLTAMQYYLKLIILPNSGGLAFPMWLTWSDSLLVLSIVSIISISISYITIAHLTKNQ